MKITNNGILLISICCYNLCWILYPDSSVSWSVNRVESGGDPRNSCQCKQTSGNCLNLLSSAFSPIILNTWWWELWGTWVFFLQTYSKAVWSFQLVRMNERKYPHQDELRMATLHARCHVWFKIELFVEEFSGNWKFFVMLFILTRNESMRSYFDYVMCIFT